LRAVALAAGISRRVYSDTRVIFITIIAIYIALAEKIGTPLISVVMRVSRISVVLNWLNLNLSVASLSWPIYIGGQVSRILSGSIQIPVFVYEMISYFDYVYDWAYLNGPQGYKDNGLY
jgi:hypothetical protein